MPHKFFFGRIQPAGHENSVHKKKEQSHGTVVRFIAMTRAAPTVATIVYKTDAPLQLHANKEPIRRTPNRRPRQARMHVTHHIMLRRHVFENDA